MARFTQFLGLFTVLFAAGSNAAEFAPFAPPSYPLAVRNPYLSAWVPGNQALDLPTCSPEFWYANRLGWSVIAKVNDEVYNLFGVTTPDTSSKNATVISGNFTSTHSIFELSAGNADFTLDFFSPVSLTDYTRQSLPFSYLTVTAAGKDGNTPSVQIYSDLDQAWTGQSESTSWNHTTYTDVSIHQLRANGVADFSESEQMALWGDVIYASRAISSGTLSSSAGPQQDVRSQFHNNSTEKDDPSWSTSGGVVAFTHDLDTVSEQKSVRFAVGYVRETAIQFGFIGANQMHYYRAEYADTASAVAHFLDDYEDALSESQELDATVQKMGNAASSQEYADVLALSVRQAFGGMDITIPVGTKDTTNVKAFIKEISSDGNINTVDVIFPMLPIFYSLAPQYIQLLLEPLVQYLETGRFPEAYVVHDLGFHYPNATGHDFSQEEKMPVETTADLLLSVAAYQAATNDTAFATSHADLFRGYADYLVENGLYPAYQLSTNDGLGEFTNMTNLGVKAAVGLTAYGQFSGHENYTTIGKSFANTIYEQGVGTRVSSDTNEKYFTLTYQTDTWFLLFNLYPDKLLGLDTFPEAAFKGQSDFYPTVHQSSGVAMEGEVVWGKTDWQMWCASISEDATKKMFVDDLYNFVSNGRNTAPFGDRYWSGGENAGLVAAGFRARPTVGGHFALVALEEAKGSQN